MTDSIYENDRIRIANGLKNYSHSMFDIFPINDIIEVASTSLAALFLKALREENNETDLLSDRISCIFRAVMVSKSFSYEKVARLSMPPSYFYRWDVGSPIDIEENISLDLFKIFNCSPFLLFSGVANQYFTTDRGMDIVHKHLGIFLTMLDSIEALGIEKNKEEAEPPVQATVPHVQVPLDMYKYQPLVSEIDLRANKFAKMLMEMDLPEGNPFLDGDSIKKWKDFISEKSAEELFKKLFYDELLTASDYSISTKPICTYTRDIFSMPYNGVGKNS